MEHFVPFKKEIMEHFVETHLSEKSLREDTYYEVFVGDLDPNDNTFLKKRYVVRDSDVSYLCGPSFQMLLCFNRRSGAAVGILSDPSLRAHQIKVLDLFGNSDQVQRAYTLISAWFKLKYGRNSGEVLLPLQFSARRVPLPSFEVQNLLGVGNSKLLKLEEETKTWIQAIEIKNLAGGPLLKGIFIYGRSSSDVEFAYQKITKMVSPGFLDEEAVYSDSDSGYDDVEYDMPHSEKRVIMHSEAENETQLSKKRRIMDPYSGAESETPVNNESEVMEETQVYYDSEGMEETQVYYDSEGMEETKVFNDSVTETETQVYNCSEGMEET